MVGQGFFLIIIINLWMVNEVVFPNELEQAIVIGNTAL